ncbi:MAG TPA: hypothetical protein VFF74_09980 [Methylophilaceae bacterium]|nr:hypothetical protein [Methylophilaceae bacterium]
MKALPVRDESHRSHVPDEFRISEFVNRGHGHAKQQASRRFSRNEPA